MIDYYRSGFIANYNSYDILNNDDNDSDNNTNTDIISNDGGNRDINNEKYW